MSEEGGLNSDTFYEATTQKERKYSVKQRNKNNCPQVNSLSEGPVNNFVGAMVRVSCAGVLFVDTQRHKPSTVISEFTQQDGRGKKTVNLV